jgi:hypothetical protein
LFSPQAFQKSLSSSSTKRQSIEKMEKKKHRKKRERKKSSKSLSFEKGEFNILREENIFKKFLCESIFSPSILPHQKPFSKLSMFSALANYGWSSSSIPVLRWSCEL